MLSGTLNRNAQRLFPLLDPTIGRAVGAYFQFQKNNGQPEALSLQGLLDDQDPSTPDQVNLSLTRNAEGTVEVRGNYGGAEVDVEITKAEKQPLRDKSNLLWGQAGETSEKSEAKMAGQVGPYPLSGWVHTYRQEIDIAMSPNLSESGKPIYVLPFALSVTPTFGGAPARVNGLPGDVPTTSTPLETTDRTTVQANLGDLAVNTEQNWVTTTWTVSTNLRAGGSRVTMMQHEKASEKESFKFGEETGTEHRSYEVEPGRAAQSGPKNYELDFANGVVSGHLASGDTLLQFALTPA